MLYYRGMARCANIFAHGRHIWHTIIYRNGWDREVCTSMPSAQQDLRYIDETPLLYV